MQVTVDFTNRAETLFSGRSNGCRLRLELLPQYPMPCQFTIRTREDQIVTSSFWFGLLQQNIVNQQINFNKLDTTNCNDTNVRELLRALKRSLK